MLSRPLVWRPMREIIVAALRRTLGGVEGSRAVVAAVAAGWWSACCPRRGINTRRRSPPKDMERKEEQPSKVFTLLIASLLNLLHFSSYKQNNTSMLDMNLHVIWTRPWWLTLTNFVLVCVLIVYNSNYSLRISNLPKFWFKNVRETISCCNFTYKEKRFAKSHNNCLISLFKEEE